MCENDSQQVPIKFEEILNDDETEVISYQQMVGIEGEKLQEKISKEVDNFTQQVTLVHNSTSVVDLPEPDSRQKTAMLRQHYLQISVEGFKSKIKEEVAEFTQQVNSIGHDEATFNERAKLLLQCHTMSAYITNCLMEKTQNKI